MAVLPDPGRSRAVLIGASTYRHLADLPAVGNNLSGFRDVLVAPMLGGLPAGNCMVVAEPATPIDVYRTLRQHAAAAEDTLLVYFAGHGRIGSRNELWLCLPDTDPDELPYSAWPYEELRRVVADSPATRKVVILDCCFSGRALADLAGDEETILGQVGIEGSYLLTASPRNAVALAPPGQRYTAFTGALLGLLNEGIPDGPELLTFAQIYPRLRATLSSRGLPRPSQQGSDTIAHLALTRNLAHTGRGGRGDFHERFTAITAQLGHAQPAVRLAGVHAMAALADESEKNRQTCVDVLCAHLRLPYDPDPGDRADQAERTAYRANREVRRTVSRVITSHLKDDWAVSWRGLNFDFTGTKFDGGDFGGAVFSGGQVSFNDAVFSGGQVSFNDAVFSGGTVSFRGAVFSGSQVSFNDAVFSGGTVSFRGAVFSGGQVGFDRAEISGGQVGFDRAVFSGAGVSFDAAVFSGGQVGFDRTVFSSGQVDFGYSVFSDGTVSFRGAKFSGSQVDLIDAVFSGSEVDFAGAVFSGGIVNFSRVRHWSHPPTFNWDGEPPAWVELPAQPAEDGAGSAADLDEDLRTWLRENVSDVLEFKASAFTDVDHKVGRNPKPRSRAEQAHEIAKALVGLLNAAGGTVIVGVAELDKYSKEELLRAYPDAKQVNDRLIIGVESEFNRSGWDAYQRSLASGLRRAIDGDIDGWVKYHALQVGDRTVCVIRVRRPPKWFYVKSTDKSGAVTNQFYGRIGGETRALRGQMMDTFKEAHPRTIV